MAISYWVDRNPQFAGPSEIHSVFKGRADLTDQVQKWILSPPSTEPFNLLITAPNGYGKSLFLQMLFTDPTVLNLLESSETLLVFPVDAYSICSCGQFWMEILCLYVDQSKNTDLHDEYQKLSLEHDENRLAENAFQILEKYCLAKSVKLLLVIDNSSLIFGDQISGQQLKLLFEYLKSAPFIRIIGTAGISLLTSKPLKKYFTSIFKEVRLPALTIKECCLLFETVSGNSFSIRQMKPFYILTGGHPRLMVKLARFYSSDQKIDLELLFMKLIDSETAYYKGIIENLPALERKIFVTLSLLWKPSTARDVALSSRIDVNKASAYLQRLFSKGLLEIVFQKGRRQWYQVKEKGITLYLMFRFPRLRPFQLDPIFHFMSSYYLDQVESPAICKIHPDLVQWFSFRDLDQIHLFPFIRKDHPNESMDKDAVHLTLLEEIENDIASNPENALGWFKLGCFLMETLDRQGDAESVFKKTLSIEPDHKNAWFMLGRLLCDQPQRYEDACQAFVKVTQLDHHRIDAWFNLGLLYSSKSEFFEMAEAAFQKILTQDAFDAQALNNYGALLMQQPNRSSDAKKVLKKAVECEPENLKALCNLGVLLNFSFSDGKSALSLFNRVLELDSRLWIAHFGSGIILDQKSESQTEAQNAMKRGLEFQPEKKLIWQSLIDSYCTSDDLRSALKTIHRFLSVFGLTPDNFDFIARSLLKSSQASALDTAEEWSRQAVEACTDNRAAFHHTLALILSFKGFWEESLEILKDVLADSLFSQNELPGLIDYFRRAAAAGFGEKSAKIIESSSENWLFEPILAGLKQALNHEHITAREIHEIGSDLKVIFLNSDLLE